MCYGDPTKSLDLACERLTPEAWAKFEADFEHFCAYSGMMAHSESNPTRGQAVATLGRTVTRSVDPLTMAWAQWAFFKGQGL